MADPYQEKSKRDAPTGEDPARLNDLNSDQKPAPPQPAADDLSDTDLSDTNTSETDTYETDTSEADTQTRMSDDKQAAVEMGQRPGQTAAPEKPTNPPHPEKDGMLWAQENKTESK